MRALIIDRDPGTDKNEPIFLPTSATLREQGVDVFYTTSFSGWDEKDFEICILLPKPFADADQTTFLSTRHAWVPIVISRYRCKTSDYANSGMTNMDTGTQDSVNQAYLYGNQDQLSVPPRGFIRAWTPVVAEGTKVQPILSYQDSGTEYHIMWRTTVETAGDNIFCGWCERNGIYLAAEVALTALGIQLPDPYEVYLTLDDCEFIPKVHSLDALAKVAKDYGFVMPMAFAPTISADETWKSVAEGLNRNWDTFPIPIHDHDVDAVYDDVNYPTASAKAQNVLDRCAEASETFGIKVIPHYNGYVYFPWNRFTQTGLKAMWDLGARTCRAHPLTAYPEGGISSYGRSVFSSLVDEEDRWSIKTLRASARGGLAASLQTYNFARNSARNQDYYYSQSLNLLQELLIHKRVDWYCHGISCGVEYSGTVSVYSDNTSDQHLLDGVTVTIGDRVYEFDDNFTVTAGNTAVTITDGATRQQAADALIAAITANDTQVSVKTETGSGGTFSTTASSQVYRADSGYVYQFRVIGKTGVTSCPISTSAPTKVFVESVVQKDVLVEILRWLWILKDTLGENLRIAGPEEFALLAYK